MSEDLEIQFYTKSHYYFFFFNHNPLIIDCSLLSLHDTLVEVKQSAEPSTIPYQSSARPQQPASRNPLLQRMQSDARMFPPITLPPDTFIPEKQQVLLP